MIKKINQEFQRRAIKAIKKVSLKIYNPKEH